MKKKLSIFNRVICCVFALFVLLNLFISNGSYSKLENRYLQGLPQPSWAAVADRSFMDEAENYSNDQLMFRSFFIKTKAILERAVGKAENNGVYYSKDKYLIEKPAVLDEEFLAKNIESVKVLADMDRFNVSLCVVPQAYEILQDKLPAGAYDDVIPAFYDQLKAKLSGSKVDIVNPTKTLSEHKNDYIFYRTDHHQTAEGSYLLYRSLAKACDYSPLAKSKFTIEEVSQNFKGTTYSKGLIGGKSDVISAYKTDINEQATIEFYGEDKSADSLFFEEHLSKKDQYSYFLDGNHGVTIVRSGEENGKHLAVFKDSYAHSLTPFLINHYESIHLIDMRYFMGDPMQYLAENNLHELLFLYGTSTFMTDDTIQKIGEYGKTSPYAHFGLVKVGTPVGGSYFADAVFLGDSLSLGFEAYGGLDEATYLCRTSMSIGGVFLTESDGTSLVEKVKAAKPKKIYVMLGINEYLAPSNKEIVMGKYADLIDRLKKDNPGAMIYMQSIMPVSEAEHARGRLNNDAIYEFNDALRKMTETKQVYFVDVYKAVCDSEGFLIDRLTGDGIHLGEEGCKLWADYLKSHVVMAEGEEAGTDEDEVQELASGKYDLAGVLDSVKQVVTFEGDVGGTGASVLMKTHSIDKNMVVNACGVVGGGSTAEEIALFEAKDEKQASEIKKQLEAYVQTRIKSFESYIPKEVPKLSKAIVYVNDTFVALVIAENAGTAKEVLEQAAQ